MSFVSAATRVRDDDDDDDAVPAFLFDAEAWRLAADGHETCRDVRQKASMQT